jgi:hypothetical protein
MSRKEMLDKKTARYYSAKVGDVGGVANLRPGESQEEEK